MVHHHVWKKEGLKQLHTEQSLFASQLPKLLIGLRRKEDNTITRQKLRLIQAEKYKTQSVHRIGHSSDTSQLLAQHQVNASEIQL